MRERGSDQRAPKARGRLCHGSARPTPPKARGECRRESSAPRGRAGWPERRALATVPGRLPGSSAGVSAPLTSSASGRSQATLRSPTTPRREWRQQSFLRRAAWAYRPAGTRQVDPGGHALLPAPDPLRDPPESLGGGHSLHPELPAPGSHSPHAARALKVWIR